MQYNVSGRKSSTTPRKVKNCTFSRRAFRDNNLLTGKTLARFVEELSRNVDFFLCVGLMLSDSDKWLHPDQTQFSLTSPSLSPFGFLPHLYPQVPVSLRSEFRRTHGETVCQTLLHGTVWRSVSTCTHLSTIRLPFQTKYQATRSNV